MMKHTNNWLSFALAVALIALAFSAYQGRRAAEASLEAAKASLDMTKLQIARQRRTVETLTVAAGLASCPEP